MYNLKSVPADPMGIVQSPTTYVSNGNFIQATVYLPPTSFNEKENTIPLF